MQASLHSFKMNGIMQNKFGNTDFFDILDNIFAPATKAPTGEKNLSQP